MSGQRLVGDYLLVGDGSGQLVAGGAIDIDGGGRVVAAGRESELGAAPGPVHRVGGLLMPGLVNGHAHGPMTLLRSAGDGLALMPWLTEAVWPREGKMTPDDAWWGMALASVEMLLAGVTTSVEMYLFEEAVADAVRTTGGRAQVMAGIISAIAPDDAAFEARLSQVTAFRAVHHDPNGRITAGFGPHSVYDLGPDRLRLVGEAAGAAGATVHIHLEETRAEREQVLGSHGRSATRLLADAGVLDNHVVAAHGVWLADDDLSLLAAAGAAVVHCPKSNLKLGSGVARVPAMLAAGVQVAVGTDGAASNDGLELWDELRLAPMLARGMAGDASAMSSTQAFDLATRAGGRAIGMPEIGELRGGAWADIVRLDLDQPAFASGVEGDLFANVVWAGSARHVSDVWVAGNRVVASGEITTIDRGEVFAQARTRGADLLA